MGAGWGGVQQLKGGGQMRDVSGHKGEASLGCRGGGAAGAHIANLLGNIPCSWYRITEETQSYLLSHRWTPWVPDKRSWGYLKQGVLKGLGALTPLVKRQDGAGATPFRSVPLRPCRINGWHPHLPDVCGLRWERVGVECSN